MEFKAKTVEEAIEEGLKELNITKEDADIQVVQSAGLLRKAVVEITPKEAKEAASESAEAEEMPAEAEEMPAEAEEKPVAAPEKSRKLHETDIPVVEYLKKLLTDMGLDCSLECKSTKEFLHIVIKGEDTHFAIGYRGETLDSLQYVCLLFANKASRFRKRLIIDAEGYREMRAKTLTELSLKLAKKVAKTGVSAELEPMNAFERRVIHTALQDDEFVSTSSEGEEPNRYVVISPIKKQADMYNHQSKNNFKKYGTGKTRSFGQKNKRF